MRRLEAARRAVAGLPSLGALFAIRTPAWQAPDEPAHYNYVRQLVEGRLPVIEPGDWDQAYLGEIVGAEFAPAYPVDEITYEDWQPPLYYLLQAPVYALSGGSLTAMRLLSVALGAGVVALAYVVGRAVFGRVVPALAVAAFVAFLPQHLAILSSVNNDALSELIIAAILALLVTRWPDAPATRRLLALGLLLGAGFLTKGQAYLMAPVVGVFLLVRYRRNRPDKLPQPVRSLLLVLVPAMLIGLLWWGRNVTVYGGVDVIGKAAHDSVVVGQPRTAGAAGAGTAWPGTLAAGASPPAPRSSASGARFGRGAGAGWRGGGAGGSGGGGGGFRGFGVGRTAVDRRPPNAEVFHPGYKLGVLGLTLLLTLGLHVAYNLTFVQHQGRYLYPALIPIGCGLVAGGLGYWIGLRLRARRSGRREAAAAGVGGCGGCTARGGGGTGAAGLLRAISKCWPRQVFAAHRWSGAHRWRSAKSTADGLRSGFPAPPAARPGTQLPPAR